jgi:hypothetical protein
VIRSPDELARAPCFSGSYAGLITGFTCGTFDLKLIKLDVVDCIHDRQRGTHTVHASFCNLSLSGHSVITFPNQVLYSHAGPVGTAKDLLFCFF